MLTRAEAKVIFAGIVNDGLDAMRLTGLARKEKREAIDMLIEVTTPRDRVAVLFDNLNQPENPDH